MRKPTKKINESMELSPSEFYEACRAKVFKPQQDAGWDTLGMSDKDARFLSFVTQKLLNEMRQRAIQRERHAALSIEIHER